MKSSSEIKTFQNIQNVIVSLKPIMESIHNNVLNNWSGDGWEWGWGGPSVAFDCTYGSRIAS